MPNRTLSTYLSNKLLSLILIVSVLSGSASAQTAKTRSIAAVKKNANVCQNCWTGVITYTKTFEDTLSSSEPVQGTTDPQNERITHNDAVSSKFSGRVIVVSSLGTLSTGARVSYDYKRTDKASVSGWTRCHNFEQDRLITETQVTSVNASGFTNDPPEEFNIMADPVNYHFGFRFPATRGDTKTDVTTSRKNFCPNSSPMQPPYSSSRESSINDERVSIDGTLDLKDPDVIAGSKSWGGEKQNGIATFKYTVTWRLTRKAMKLMITDIKFYHPIYPSPTDWHEIAKGDYTTDGNQVKVVATISNISGRTQTATPQFKELIENTTLPDGPGSVTIPPFEDKDVELIWDTSGYAWRESGGESQPEINRQIEVTIPDDSATGDIRVFPKPIIVVPGVWSKKDDYHKFRDFVRIVNDKWKVSVAPVNIDAVAADNAAAIDKKVRDTQLLENAWHVDLVGHSTGGLAARVYVNSLMPTLSDGRPAAIHLIMAGTPNLGTPCVRGVDGLISRFFNHNADALGEITSANMKRFNLMVTGGNGTKFATLAGVSFPKTCQRDKPGDGITTQKSAVWTVADTMISNAPVNHMHLLSETSHFKQIYKWLAVPPKGDHAPAASGGTASFSNGDSTGPIPETFSRNYGAMFHGASVEENETVDEPAPDFVTGVKIPGDRSTEISIPVTTGSELSIILYAQANISATLLDEKGEIIGRYAVPDSDDIFRTITVKRPFGNTTWKLKIENREKTDLEVAVTAFMDYNTKIASGPTPQE